MFKKLTSGVISAAMLITAAGSTFTRNSADIADAAFSANYAEALQKSIYFYECQQAGPLPEWNRVEWKGNPTADDEIKGGWYDAGDHVKFNLPMAYSASMLAWGLYQYPDGVEKVGEMTNYVNNLEFVLDYFVDCDLGDEVVIQVGDGTVDHTWWGPAELIKYGMEDSGTSYADARYVTKVKGGSSCVLGEMAAALASGYAALDGRIDDSKRQKYLKTAQHYYEMATTDPNDDVYAKTDAMAGGFYRSSHFYDELFYAANWMYIATGDDSFLKQAEKEFAPHLGKQLGSDELAYGWTHCWDDTMQGGLLLYAINTGDDFYKGRVKRHFDYAFNELTKVDGVLAYYDSWGCARYSQTDGFLAAVASDTIFKGEDTSAYEKYYENQINYVLGDNPLNQSYVVGYGEKSPNNVHHRTAHGSWKNDAAIPERNRHVLYGALAGGPDQSGKYVDDRGNYINNEVATDYNAGFTALLCKMTDKYGGETDASFPPVEVHDSPEFYVEAKTNGPTSSGITVSFKITNHSAWPARVQDNISFRYYVDMSEVKAMGKNPEDVVIRCDRDQSAMYSGKGVKTAEISKMTQYEGDIYYVEVNLPDGRAVLPVSEGMQQCEILLAFVMPDYGSGWDASNDFSNKDLLGGKPVVTADGKEGGIISPYIPVYVNGELYYGYEPDGTYKDGLASMSGKTPVQPTTTVPKTTTPKTTTTTTTVTTTTAKIQEELNYGDANCDTIVDISDVVLLKSWLINSEKYSVSEKGLANSDVQGKNNGINGNDIVAIQQYALKLINSLPVD